MAKTLDFVTTREIAERARVGPSTPRQWRSRYEDFPEPIVTGYGARWDWHEVEKWLDKHDMWGE